MTLDIIALIVAGLLIALGYRSGATTQVCRVLAVAAAFLAAPNTATVFKEIHYGAAEFHQPILEWGILAASALAVYLLVVVVGALLVKLMRWTNEDLSRKDRLLGALLGAVKATAVVYLLASSVLFLREPLEDLDPNDSLRLQSSALLDTVSDHQVAIPWALPDLARLHDLLRASDAHGVAHLRDDPASSRVLMRPDVKALLHDPEVQRAVQAHDLSTLLARQDVRDLLADRRFVKALRASRPPQAQ